MSEPLFSIIDIIMFVLSGMALGFVIGAKVMDLTHKASAPPPMSDMAALAYLTRMSKDDGEAFHEECGDR